MISMVRPIAMVRMRPVMSAPAGGVAVAGAGHRAEGGVSVSVVNDDRVGIHRLGVFHGVRVERGILAFQTL